jgi:hypothetical protein
MSATVTPLPSLLRASAWDAGNARMRKAGRSKWTRGDFNEAARTHNRLVRACYGKPEDPDGSPLPFIRFQIAETMQKRGMFNISSKMPAIHRQIDEAMEAA